MRDEEKSTDTQNNTDVSSGEPSTGVNAQQDTDAATQDVGDKDKGVAPEGETGTGGDQETSDTEGEEQDVEGAPEEYDEFDIPEGVKSLDEKTLDGFKGIAKELNLTQEQAQKLVDFDAQRELAQHEMAKKWAEDFKQRPNYQEELRFAAKGRDFLAQDNPDLKQILADPRIGNNPTFIRALEKVGRTVSEDDMHDGGSRASKTQSVEDVMFGDMFNN